MNTVIFYIQIQKLGGGTDTTMFYRHKLDERFFKIEIEFNTTQKPESYIDVNEILYFVKYAVYEVATKKYYCLVNKA